MTILILKSLTCITLCFQLVTYGQCKGPYPRPIFRGFPAELAVESANSILESADSTKDSVIVGRLSILNMFDILNLWSRPPRVGRLLESADYWSRPTLESADYWSRPTIGVGRLLESADYWSRPTIGVGRRQIGLVGTGL